MNRGKCEYSECKCSVYIHSKLALCKKCNHGHVWHKLLKNDIYFNQFKSNRKYARKPTYKIIYAEFCDCIDNLPA